MKRRKPLKRKKRINPINQERRAKRKAEAFGPQAKLARTMQCAACGRHPPSQAAHVRSRGAGGKDRGNVVGLCATCHSIQHTIGIRAFQERYHVNLEALAKTLERLAYGSVE